MLKCLEPECSKINFKTKQELVEALSVYVNDGKDLDKLIDLRNEKLSKAAYKSPDFNSPGGGQNGYRKDKMADAMAGLQKIDNRVTEILNNYQEHLEQVQNIINNLYPNYDHMIIMQWRYINGEPWGYIAQKTGFSKSHLYNLHKQAIEMLLEKSL